MKFFCVAAALFSVTSNYAAAFTVPGRASTGNYKSAIPFGTSLSMATWSDSRAVKDYQNFLASGAQEIEMAEDGPSVIVYPAEGPNQMAEALWAMGMGDDITMTADQQLPADMGGRAEYPIYIVLPPTQLTVFIQNMPDCFRDRSDDLIFFSGGLYYGNIEDTLKQYGLCRDSTTQVLMTGCELTPAGTMKDLSTNLGIDAYGEEKWAGECAATGKWQGAIAKRLERSAVRCSTDFYRDWRRKMWERSILDVCFNLIGVVRQEPTTLANVAQYYEEEVGDMVWQISQQLRGWKAMTLTYGFEERMLGVAENTGGEQATTLVDEMYPFLWGNSVFTESPMVLEYLHFAKDEYGLLPSVQLPPKKTEGDLSTKMRQGVLRADGKI